MKTKYKLIYNTRKEYESGVGYLEWMIYFEIHSIYSSKKDPENLTIYITSYDDIFMNWMCKEKGSTFYKDGSVSGMPIMVYERNWGFWNEYKKKEN